MALDPAAPDDARVESALRLAFGDASAPGAGPASVGGACATLGRFDIVREIARGGIGIVLEARDRTLGRDVAVKVLKPELRRSIDALRRFVEEARIGSRLEHPGTVPVYEMGLDADGAPWFAMQRIRGDTLATILAARSSPEDGLHHHLGTYLAVCRALAYAHSLGIVHRDVKPANVMVGAFGEVQLVDWGLAKVLGSTRAEADRPGGPDAPRDLPAEASVAGSLLGTPRYMAPEQAEGRVADVDERTDVFALGGVLAEILVGAPPPDGVLSGASPPAAPPGLASVRRRLATSGVDPVLKALACECLEPDRDRRPAHAGVVAHRVEEHLADLDRRVRVAEVAAAESRARAEGERRRRRLAWALVTSVVAAVLGVGGVLFLRDAERRSRAEEAARRVAVALHEASEKRVLAEGGSDPVLWREALDAARVARAAAETGDAALADQVRVLAMVEGLEHGLQRAREAVAQRERDRRMCAQFARLDVLLLADDDMGEATVDARLERFFASYRLSPAAPPTEAEVRRFRDAGLGPRIAQALWTWSRARRGAGSDEAPVLALADAVDPDSDRARIRRVTGAAEVVAMADALPFASASPDTLLAYAEALQVLARDLSRAAHFAVAATERAPGSVRAQLRAAGLLAFAAPPDLDRALAAATAAVALDPTNGAPWEVLADILGRREEQARAWEAARTALRMEPDWYRARLRYAVASTAVGETYRGGLVVLPLQDERVRAKPDGEFQHFMRGNTLGCLGRYAEAARELEAAIRLRPAYPQAEGPLARALLRSRDLEGAIRHATASRDANASNPFAHRFLGEVLLAAGRYAEARTSLDAAAERAAGTDEEFGRRLDALRTEAARREALSVGGPESPDASHPFQSLAEGRSFAEVWAARGRFSSAHEAYATVLDLWKPGDDPIEAAELFARAAIVAVHAAEVEPQAGRAGRERAGPPALGQALGWMRRALAVLDVPPGTPLPGPRLDVIVPWLEDPWLSPVRDPAALARLDPADRTAWAGFWADVAAVLARPLEPAASPAAAPGSDQRLPR